MTITMTVDIDFEFTWKLMPIVSHLLSFKTLSFWFLFSLSF